jgi:integrase
MPSKKITTSAVSAAKPSDRLYILYDTELPGFGLRVMPSGFKSWVVEYRPRGAGRSASKKRLALGSAAVLTAAQARTMAKDTLAAVRRGDDPIAARKAERGTVSVAELGEAFLVQHVERKRKASTAKFYRRALELHVFTEIGTKKARAVTRSDILKLQNGLREKPVMANRVLAIVGSMFGWASKEAGLVPEGFNPASRLEKNREQGRERYLTTDELERLGSALREAETSGLPWNVDVEAPKAKHFPKEENRRTVISPYATAAIRLLILTGCRLREILHLRWSEVDFERGMLHLPDSKTGRKSVVLNAPALAVLDGVPRVGEFVIAGRPPQRRDREDRPRSDLKKPWSAIRRRARLDGVRIHDLRHSFASVGAGAGLGLPIVGKLLGHTQASTTQKYSHLDNDPLRRASDAIGATIAAALNGPASELHTVVPLKRRGAKPTREG